MRTLSHSHMPIYPSLSLSLPIRLHIYTPKYRVSSSILIYPKIAHYNSWHTHLQLTRYFLSSTSCSLYNFYVVLFLKSRTIVVYASFSCSSALSFCLCAVSILLILLRLFYLLHESFLLCTSFLLLSFFILKFLYSNTAYLTHIFSFILILYTPLIYIYIIYIYI
jgi:hypothetical protein